MRFEWHCPKSRSNVPLKFTDFDQMLLFALTLSDRKTTLQSMKARVSFMTGAIALAICLVCPLVEMFDQWDRTLQTGNDTEYLLVLVALCVGAVFALRRLILTFLPSLQGTSAGLPLRSSLTSLPFLVHPTELVPASGSPPRLSLRI